MKQRARPAAIGEGCLLQGELTFDWDGKGGAVKRRSGDNVCMMWSGYEKYDM